VTARGLTIRLLVALTMLTLGWRLTGPPIEKETSMTSPDVRRRVHLNRLPLALATCAVAAVLLFQPALTAEKTAPEMASGAW